MQGFGPSRALAALFDLEAERMANFSRRLHDIAFGRRGAYEGKRLLPERAQIIAIPFLPLLAEIDGLKQIRARMADPAIFDGSEIGNGDTLNRRLTQEQVADRCMRGLGKVFQLLERWPRLFTLPIGKPRKPVRQRVRLQPARSRAQRNIAGFTSTRMVAALGIVVSYSLPLAIVPC